MKWVWRHHESVKSLGEPLGTSEPDWMSSQVGGYLSTRVNILPYLWYLILSIFR